MAATNPVAMPLNCRDKESRMADSAIKEIEGIGETYAPKLQSWVEAAKQLEPIVTH
jgi:hypothetical protein